MTQTLSQRAAAGALEQMPQSERALSEQYRIAAEQWAVLDGEARTLEAAKDSELASRMKKLTDANPRLSHAAAERDVKADPEWRSYVKNMVDARTEANLARVRVNFIDKKFSEWQSRAANTRQEMRMSR